MSVSDAANAAVNDASDAVFTIVLSDDDIYEDNDTLATAATLTPGIYEGLVLRDEDYFKVYVEEGKDLQVSISGAAFLPSEGNDMDIELYNASGDLLAAAVSGSTSEMLYLSNLAAGWYFIRNAWVDVAHNYTLTIASGDLPLGEISGRVTDIRGSGIANVWVMFYEPSGSWSLLRGYALTDSNGDYRFAYTAGDHKVQFSTTRPECTVVGSYVDEWYDDVATLGEAQTLSTAAGSSLTGIDAVLGDAGMVTGVITGPEGQPLQYATPRRTTPAAISLPAPSPRPTAHIACAASPRPVITSYASGLQTAAATPWNGTTTRAGRARPTPWRSSSGRRRPTSTPNSGTAARSAAR